MAGMMDNAKKLGKKAHDKGWDKKAANEAKSKFDKNDKKRSAQDSRQQ